MDETLAKFQAELDELDKLYKYDIAATGLTQYFQKGLIKGLPLEDNVTTYTPTVMEAHEMKAFIFDNTMDARDIAEIMQPQPTTEEMASILQKVLDNTAQIIEYDTDEPITDFGYLMCADLLYKAVQENRLIIPKYIMDRNKDKVVDDTTKFMLCVLASTQDKLLPPELPIFPMSSTDAEIDNYIKANIDYFAQAVIVTRLQNLYKELLEIELEWRRTGGLSEPPFYILGRTKAILQQAQHLAKLA